jgi:alpha-tubulin suppressor-like RCC1 family protein
MAIGLYENALIDINDDVWIFGLQKYKWEMLGGKYEQHNASPVKIENIKAKDIAINRFGLLIIDLNDDIWSSDNKNMLSKIQGIKGKSIAVGNSHGAIMGAGDNLWMFGDVRDGKLGFPLNYPENEDEDYCYEECQRINHELNERYKIPTLLSGIKAKSVAVGDYDTIIIDMNNNVLIWGRMFNTETPLLIEKIKGKQVAIGAYHLLILDFDGNVFVLGENHYKQLGAHINYTKELTLIQEVKARYICAGEYTSGIIGFRTNIL